MTVNKNMIYELVDNQRGTRRSIEDEEEKACAAGRRKLIKRERMILEIFDEKNPQKKPAPNTVLSAIGVK